MSDDLTKPLIGEKTISFADDRKNSVSFGEEVSVRDSFYPNGERHYSLDGPKTESRSKNKSGDIDETRFGSSTTAKPLDPKQLQKIQKEKQELKKKDEYRSKYGDEAFKIEYGEDEFTRIYGSECDHDKPCCNDKCTLVGGKKTKRRKYTKKQSKRQRSRKSRRSKKSSKNKSK
jgi:hypothetical protein